MTVVELKEGRSCRQTAIADFEEKERRSDGLVTVNSLSDGLTRLRKLMFERVHDDVERQFGMDSMLMPTSEENIKRRTLLEIELYQIAITAIHVDSYQYVQQAESWFLQWLTELRLGRGRDNSLVRQRLSDYLKLEKAQRRLAFTDALVHALPEAERAPLVLYRLFPLAIKVVTSVSFSDATAATAERDRQVAFLPAIGDCSECHGRLLENGDVCRTCGNPVWNYQWLRATE